MLLQQPLVTFVLLFLGLLLIYCSMQIRSSSASRDRRQSLRTALTVVQEDRAAVALHWNINTAATPKRLAALGACIRSHSPVLVGLNEVALDPAAFAKTATAWGFPHSLLLKTDRKHRFNLGLMATTPLERHPSSTSSPFFHGLLCARLSAWKGAHVCVTRLPRSSEPPATAPSRLAASTHTTHRTGAQT